MKKIKMRKKIDVLVKITNLFELENNNKLKNKYLKMLELSIKLMKETNMNP